MKINKVLVTGGAGFIGSHIVDLLIEKNYEVIVVDNLSTGKKTNLNTKAKFYNADITNADQIQKIFANEKPDAVCHQAAQINVRKSIADPVYDAKENIIGTINILNSCIKTKVKKFVYASSGGARYGEPIKVPCDESHQIVPLSPYGISKHTAEHYIEYFSKIYGFDYNIVAYGNVYGPRQDPLGEAGVISIFLDCVSNKKICKIFGDGEQTRDYVFVLDVAKANLKALKNETKSKNFNIGTGISTSVNELFNKMEIIIGEAKSVNTSPIPGEVKHICLDISLAAKELGWKPEFDLDNGLKNTVAWFKNEFKK